MRHRTWTRRALPLCQLVLFLAAPTLTGVSLHGQGFFVGNRWTTTATDGSGLSRGDATNLTWGFVGDGTDIRGGVGEARSNSDLVSFLDTNIGAGGGGSDYTNRPWFSLFEDSYNRWGEVSGLNFSYENDDDGVSILNTSGHFQGSLNVRADMRIGGHSIDGQSGSNTLAYNYFPNHGDMVIDTDNSTFYGNGSNNYIGLRNVVMHEVGHGLGISHLVSDDSAFLMEPFINTSFDGPQFADILAVQRLYGDQFEEGNGNDTSTNASQLGALDKTATIIGADASDKVVGANDVDFVSIDGSNDTDFFSFTVGGSDKTVILELTPMGPTYHAEEQNGNNSNNFVASAQNDLTLTLFDTDGSTILATSNTNGLGGNETISELLAAGTYFVRVTGAQDEVQFYQLSASAVPEPATLATVSLLSVGGFFYWRRRKRAPEMPVREETGEA